jgi:hypothetical protein
VERFPTLNELKSGQIVPDLQAVYGPDALALVTVKKCSKSFGEGRTNLSDNTTSGRLLIDHLAKAIRSVLRQKRFICCPRSFVGLSGLHSPRACDFSMTTWAWKKPSPSTLT